MASRGVHNVFDDIKVLEPSRISSTPRFWNVLYNEFKKLVEFMKGEVGEEEAKKVRGEGKY